MDSDPLDDNSYLIKINGKGERGLTEGIYVITSYSGSHYRIRRIIKKFTFDEWVNLDNPPVNIGDVLKYYKK